MGGAAGWGNSEADLAHGQVGEVLKDTGTGFGIGAAGGAVSEVASEVANAFRGKAATEAQKVLEKETAARASDVSSAAGTKGNTVMEGRNALKTAEEIVAHPHATKAQKEAADAFLNSEFAVKLRQGVYDNAIPEFARKAGKIEEAQRLLDEAIKANDPALIKAAAEKAVSVGAAGKAIWDRVYNYGGRALGAYAGYKLGGNSWGGMAIGAALGGNPGTAIGNLVRKNPAFRKNAFTVLEKVIGKGADLGRFTGLLTAAAARGREALLSTVHVLETSPKTAAEFEELQKRLLEGSPDGGTP
jgi:hypothetical protein